MPHAATRGLQPDRILHHRGTRPCGRRRNALHGRGGPVHDELRTLQPNDRPLRDFAGDQRLWRRRRPHLVANIPFLVAPAGLPVAAPPAGMVNPRFTSNCQATDTVLLVLDRSGSMLWNTENDFGEVCGNGVDDDGDGSVDETDDCTQPRLAFVQAAARAWLALANGQGVKAGVVSFNQLPSLDAPFQDVNATNLPTLNTAVDNLVAGGNTAIRPP